eukprot:451423_1
MKMSLIMICRIGLAFAVGFTYPLLANVIKNSLGSVIYGLGIRNDRYSFYALLCGAHVPGDHSAHKDVTMIPLHKYIPLWLLWWLSLYPLQWRPTIWHYYFNSMVQHSEHSITSYSQQLSMCSHAKMKCFREMRMAHVVVSIILHGVSLL